MELKPGTYSQLDLEITLPTGHFQEPRKRLETYLRSTYLPYSLQRQGGAYAVNVHKKGRKKKVLAGGQMCTTEDAFVARLQIGTKFDVMAFLAQFGIPNAYHLAKLVVFKIVV